MIQEIHSGILLDEHMQLTLSDLCGACASSEEWIIELVDEGALEPINLQAIGNQYTQWVFTVDSLEKARTAKRLQRDLNINIEGIALALSLLEKIQTLEARLRRLQLDDDI